MEQIPMAQNFILTNSNVTIMKQVVRNQKCEIRTKMVKHSLRGKRKKLSMNLPAQGANQRHDKKQWYSLV